MDENEVVEEVVEKPKKKKKSFLVRLLIFIVVLGLIIVGLGFAFPGLLWTRSLGVSYTAADYDSMVEKLNYVKDEAPIEGLESDYEYVFGDVVAVDVEFTSEELTAFFNYNRPSYFAVSNVEIKLNDDGSIEASGQINVDYVLEEFLRGEFSIAEVEEEIPALGILPDKVNIYFKASGSITNNSVSPSVESVSVQGVPIPSKYVNSSEAISRVVSGINSLISSHNAKTGSSFESIKVEGGVLKFKGIVPSSLERIRIE